MKILGVLNQKGGVGKTTLIHTLPYILPNLNENEKLEVSEIYSRAGILSNELIHKTLLNYIKI